MKKIAVITGCLGFIGKYVARKFLMEGWHVIGIDKMTYVADMSWLHDDLAWFENFTFIHDDIAYMERLPDCDVVINTAAESHVGNSIISSRGFFESNITGVKNLLELIRNKEREVSELPLFLHFSTDEVYSDILEGSYNENSPLKPSNPYAATKAAADQLIFAWARTYDIPYLVVRMTNNYGIDQYPEKLIPLAVRLLQRGKKIRLHDLGEPIRNWLHVEDTADAIYMLANLRVINEIYNIAGGYEQTNYEVIRKVLNCYHGLASDADVVTDYVDFSYARKGQDVRYALDDSKIRDLGWEPVRTFDAEIVHIVDAAKERFVW